MEEQLISFETAKSAKIKGFNELCGFHYSYGNGDSAEPQTGRVYIGGFVDDVYNPRKYNNTELDGWELPYGNFSAPTQGLLQKWLREVHNIDVNVVRDGEIHYGDETRWTVTVSNWNDIQIKTFSFVELKFPQHSHYIDFKTYETALEKGLQEALKLLPNKE